MTKKSTRRERGFHELYTEDPERADAVLGLNRSPEERRRFLRIAGSATAALFLTESIPFAHGRPMGLPPSALAQSDEPFVIEGKDGLVVLNERPINAEAPVTLLDDDVTPNARHFIRNNGVVPERALSGDVAGWTLRVDGEVDKPLDLSFHDLQSRYTALKLQLCIECGGNGRAGFRPPASGNQWKLGAVGCAEYTGVRLKDVLADAGVRTSAVFVAYYGEDVHLSGNPDEVVISRGIPMIKALDENTILAWEMNGEPLPAQHGFPLRLVAAGWPASVSGKWLNRLWVRDQVHDGPKMGGFSYRVPKYPVAPGGDVDAADMKIIEAMPVKSIITRPGTGAELRLGETLSIGGHAWCGDGPVESMHVSIDFGMTWMEARLDEPANAFAWQHWRTELRFPVQGHYELWARATDHAGRQQPMVIPGWNPRGYLNNAMQRIAVSVHL